MYITKNSVLLQLSQSYGGQVLADSCEHAIKRFLMTTFIYTTYYVDSSLQWWIMIRKHENCWNSAQTTVLVFKTGFLLLRLRFEILGQPEQFVSIFMINLILATFLQRDSVVTYFWDVFFGGAETAGTLWTWIKRVFMLRSNFEAQKWRIWISVTTSFLLIWFWKSNHLGAPSAALPLNTLGVLNTSD